MDEALYTIAGYLATPQRSYCLGGGVLNCSPRPSRTAVLSEVVLRVDINFKVCKEISTPSSFSFAQ
jgi:hypothetical protein